MSKVILYTTHCPKCKVLETRLRQAHIEYEIIEDENVMLNKGFMEAPKLEVDEKVMGFADAMDYLKELENNDKL